jgi:CheY-like chemotaxis protein/two-component sensor histidine kinase
VITALFDAEGELRGFAKVTRDMTDRRQIDKLQEADRLKNEFLALLAHELRNPLAPIRSAIHVLGSPVAADDELARARAIAERQIQHMSRLLDDLLDVARVSQGKLELRREVIEVSRIVRRAVEAEQPFIQTQGLALTVDAPAEGLGVDADPTRLQQILTNLLNNAAKYTESGGRIWLTAEAEGDHVVLRVRDSGIGIDPPAIPRLFQLFEQGERRMERSAGGVGVGLALVKRLVEMHGGSVHAFSAGLGRGSEFAVRLPRVDIAPRVTGPHATLQSRSTKEHSLRILVVDDNVDAADGLKMLLELNGEQVRAAYDGESALKVAREFRPQVALLDVGMPRMDGYEVARRLKAAPETRQAALVAVTGWGQPEDRKRSSEAGFDLHLVKPVEPSELERLLDSLKAKRAP